ncbi:MAG: regulatory iron-sulfur-containing complex subunit RicT [Kiritimatiellia bacterium]
MGDGILASCRIPDGDVPAEDAVCLLEIDGVREFGRFIRLCPEHASCYGGVKGEFLQVAGADDLDKLAGNGQAMQRARNVALKWAEENGQQIVSIRLRFSVRRERLSLMLHAGEFFNASPLCELLEKRFQTKVALRFASSREIAGAIGGLGVCGRVLCCCNGVSALAPIDAKFAKQAGMNLYDSAAAGLCARLKCCVNYESGDVDDEPPRRRSERQGVPS